MCLTLTSLHPLLTFLTLLALKSQTKKKKPFLRFAVSRLLHSSKARQFFHFSRQNEKASCVTATGSGRHPSHLSSSLAPPVPEVISCLKEKRRATQTNTLSVHIPLFLVSFLQYIINRQHTQQLQQHTQPSYTQYNTTQHNHVLRQGTVKQDIHQLQPGLTTGDTQSSEADQLITFFSCMVMHHLLSIETHSRRHLW